MTKCRYCGSTHFTRDNLGEMRAIVPPGDSEAVHFGCLRHWLLDDAIKRNFPGITKTEREVLKLRMGVAKPGESSLVALNEVGRKMGWTRGMRASQVQRDAMSRLERRKSQLATSAEQQGQRNEALVDAVEAARTLVKIAEPLLRGKKPLRAVKAS